MAVSVAAAVIVATPAAAQSGLSGSYVYNRSGSENIDAAVERAVAGMSFITRPVARSRLKKATIPASHLRITTDGVRVRIASDGRPPLDLAMNGAVTRWAAGKGEGVQASATLDATGLRVRLRAADGERESFYRASVDGRTLSVAVTIRSSRLGAPLTYRLRYDRER